MCGIAGIAARPGAPITAESLNALRRALAHRGPDGSAIMRRGAVALVQTRLAIVDPAGGDQPLTDSAGRALIANAEIYNDRDVRDALSGARFVTGSDCESALYLYARHGDGFAAGLRGMYALAIDDPVRGRLVLARDPFGIKPLYVAETERGVAFASEPQALIAAGLVAADLEPAARDELLALQFNTGRRTVWRGIQRVAPGETLIVRDGRIAEKRTIAALPRADSAPPTEAQALAAFDRAWEDSVRAHQRADVPYGMFLSGGLDSAAVLAMMARLNAAPVLAFTAAFPGTDVHDERAAARAVARAFNARHEEVEITPDDFWQHLPRIAAAMDDPAADYAIVPSYLLAARARAEVKVVLTGEGGDELLAGYGRYRAALRPWPFRKPPRRRSALAGLGILREDASGWRDGLDAIESDIAARGLTGLMALQAADCAAWLPNDLLTKLDRCLMAHGVEGRVPFLDPVVAAATFTLPEPFKIRGGRGKWLLRRWLADHAPAAAAFAPKRGFTVPVAAWIAARADRLAPLLAGNPAIAEVCRPDRVDALCRMAADTHGQALWMLLFYALWHNRHMLGHAADGDVFDVLAASCA
ncbi:MAG: asparagine synthase (glutamine-hydrolyzing) [Rhodospirillaceae bacterium]|nr:asparagine synthase (glutamine-hydrolyzing) [Rhodospirillaceae bacterium]